VTTHLPVAAARDGVSVARVRVMLLAMCAHATHGYGQTTFHDAVHNGGTVDSP